jgi:hypothetical protein
MTSPTRRTSARWAALNLSPPRPGGGRRNDPTVADWLISGLLAEHWDGDPVEGMIEGVRADLLGIADLMAFDSAGAGVLRALAHRLAMAGSLLAMADGQEHTPAPEEGSSDNEGAGEEGGGEA